MSAGKPRDPSPPTDDWTAPGSDDVTAPGTVLRIDIDGFEGPLDLLLALARTQKVDLAQLSVTALVDQYLSYIDDARGTHLEVAADYLVMAAWLAFLKSRLLIPREQSDDGGPTGEELAQRLNFRLVRLDAMRGAAAKLLTRHRLGRDVFARGNPEGMKTIRETQYTAGIYDLLQAYATRRVHAIRQVHHVDARKVWSVKDARRQLERLIGKSAGGWVQLDLFLHQYIPLDKNTGEINPRETQRSVLAASFGASLELAREGFVDIRQDAAYGPIYMMKRSTPEGS
jgi:segregation and condensation protein A